MANIERLRELRRVVEAAPEDRFRMRSWCERAECGTARCLAGWFAVDPWAQENTEILDIFEVMQDGFVFPKSNGAARTFSRLAEVFNISEDDSRKLFGEGLNVYSDPHAVTKAEVIANVDRLIDGDEAVPYGALDDDSDDDDTDFEDEDEYDDDDDDNMEEDDDGTDDYDDDDDDVKYENDFIDSANSSSFLEDN